MAGVAHLETEVEVFARAADRGADLISVRVTLKTSEASSAVALAAAGEKSRAIHAGLVRLVPILVSRANRNANREVSNGAVLALHAGEALGVEKLAHRAGEWPAEVDGAVLRLQNEPGEAGQGEGDVVAGGLAVGARHDEALSVKKSNLRCKSCSRRGRPSRSFGLCCRAPCRGRRSISRR